MCVHARKTLCMCVYTNEARPPNTGTGEPGLYLENVVVGVGVLLGGGAFALEDKANYALWLSFADKHRD